MNLYFFNTYRQTNRKIFTHLYVLLKTHVQIVKYVCLEPRYNPKMHVQRVKRHPIFYVVFKLF